MGHLPFWGLTLLTMQYTALTFPHKDKVQKFRKYLAVLQVKVCCAATNQDTA